jgi:hypothetical protein
LESELLTETRAHKPHNEIQRWYSDKRLVPHSTVCRLKLATLTGLYDLAQKGQFRIWMECPSKKVILKAFCCFPIRSHLLIWMVPSPRWSS